VRYVIVACGLEFWCLEGDEWHECGCCIPLSVWGRAYGMTTCRTCKEGEVDHGGKGSGAGVDLPVFRVWLVRLSMKAKILTVSGVVPLLEASTRQPSPAS
jgi:hypothetical protein